MSSETAGENPPLVLKSWGPRKVIQRPRQIPTWIISGGLKYRLKVWGLMRQWGRLTNWNEKHILLGRPQNKHRDEIAYAKPPY